MCKKIIYLIFLLVWPAIIIGQTKFGPSVNIGYTFFGKTSKIYDFKGGVSPSFGITMQNYVNYWLSIKTSVRYSFSELETVTTNGGLTDHIKGQFADLIVSGRFSDFDDDSKILLYGMTGIGNSVNLISKGAELYLADAKYRAYVPYFIVGAGMGIKMTFFSELDLCVSYSRYLAPLLVLDNTEKARCNAFNLTFIGLF